MTKNVEKKLQDAVRKLRKGSRVHHLRMNPVSPAVDIPLEGSQKQQEKLVAVVNEMCKSPAGKMILEQAVEAGYSLKFDPEAAKEGIYGYADPCDCVCALSSRNTLEENIVTMAHELRHAYQFGFEITEKVTCTTHDTKTKLHLDKTMEADAESFGCLVAWELKEVGRHKCWDAFAADFPEVSEPFEKKMAETKDVNQARTAAFLGWYDNADRRDSYDDTFLQELKDCKPSVLKKSLKSIPAADMIAEFCCDPGQTKPYFTADPAILEQGKFVTVYEDVKDEIVKYHEKRNKLPGRVPDKSIEKLETQARLGEEESEKAKPVSVYAKKIAIKNSKKKVLEGAGKLLIVKKKMRQEDAVPPPRIALRLIDRKSR